MNFYVLYINTIVVFQNEVVNVKLPRFRIEDSWDLSAEIQALGSSEIFLPGEADFANMVQKNLIHLSQFKHRYVSRFKFK